MVETVRRTYAARVASTPSDRRRALRLEVDAGLTALFAVVAEVELALSDKLIFDGTRQHGVDAIGVLLPVLPLLWRRAAPFGCAVGVAGAVVVTGTVLGTAVLFFGALFPFLVATYTSAAWSRKPYDRLVLLVAAALFGPMPLWIDRFDPPYDYVLPAAVVLFAWATGRAVRRWQDQNVQLAEALGRAERARAVESELAVALERGRIARELHDVVAHSISIIVLQSSAARLDATGPLADTLRTVERTGREALAEMRRLLGVLRSDDAPELGPQPGLDALPALVAGMRTAGLTTELATRGERRPLPEAQDVTAYRIIQEGLTNALKHGADGCARVQLDYQPGRLRLSVSNRAGAVVSDLGGGQGLVGIRERAALFGGSCRSGPDGAGGFETEVVLPIPAELL